MKEPFGSSYLTVTLFFCAHIFFYLRSSEPMHIGNNNVFEVGSVVRAKSVGDHNIFETKCMLKLITKCFLPNVSLHFYGLWIVLPYLYAGSVGDQVSVGNGCVFGAGTQVTPSQTVADNSVFYGEPLKHRLAGERPSVRQLNILIYYASSLVIPKHLVNDFLLFCYRRKRCRLTFLVEYYLIIITLSIQLSNEMLLLIKLKRETGSLYITSVNKY